MGKHKAKYLWAFDADAYREREQMAARARRENAADRLPSRDLRLRPIAATCNCSFCAGVRGYRIVDPKVMTPPEVLPQQETLAERKERLERRLRANLRWSPAAVTSINVELRDVKRKLSEKA